MKYSELVSFNPIETVIQIKQSNQRAAASNLVKTFVISDRLAKVYTDVILPQLQFETPQDNKGILLIGNYGTGKSHFMSVISSVAEYDGIFEEINHEKAKSASKIINGKFLVQRIEIGAVTSSLRDIIFSEIESFLRDLKIDFKFLTSSQITSNKDDLERMMATIQDKFPTKGFLIVIDEMLDYLKTRDNSQQIQDLSFLREMGEFCQKSKFRLLVGLQETLFENPSFSFAADTLKKVKDRFEQTRIVKEDIDFVIKHRLLNKTGSQKNVIRDHLEQFIKLYPDMLNRLEEYVELYPIHPSYTDNLEDIGFIEKRHILKSVGNEIKNLLDKEVPKNDTGLISYDSYWDHISEDPFYQTDEDVKKVIEISNVIVHKINSIDSIYKSVAKRIIHALSIHRLTTGEITNNIGLTSEELRDGLCLITESLPQKDPDFLRTTIDSVLKKIHLATDGSYISNNKENGQWYIDIRKVIDYDGKIKQTATTLSPTEKDLYFFEMLQKLMEITIPSHVADRNIWQHQIMWKEHGIDREGYMFFGAPNERTTAHPPRYFYIYFLQIFKTPDFVDEKKNDEIFFRFKDLPSEIYEQISYYASARKLEKNSSSGDKQTYQKHAAEWQKKVIDWIRENYPHCIQVTYQGRSKPIQEIPVSKKVEPFRNTVNDISVHFLSNYFEQRFPSYPKFSTPITKGENSNLEQYVEQTRKFITTDASTRISDAICSGLQILDPSNRLDPSQSIYAKHILEVLKKKSQAQVTNRDEIMTTEFESEFDKKYHLESDFVALILAALAYNGDIVITYPAKKIKADNISEINDLDYSDFIGFKNISKPSGIPEAELVELFKILDLQSGKVKNEKTLESAVSDLQSKINVYITDSSKLSKDIENGLIFSRIPIFDASEIDKVKKIIEELRQFCDSLSRYDTVPKLKNLKINLQQISDNAKVIAEYKVLKKILDTVHQLRSITDYLMNARIVDQKLKQDIMKNLDELIPAIKNNTIDLSNIYPKLEKFKKDIVEQYFALHNKSRLNAKNDLKRNKILSSDIYLKNLALRNITFIDSSELNNEIARLERLKKCDELQKKDLEKSFQCKCEFNPELEKDDAESTLNEVGENLERIFQNNIKTLFDNLQDPTVKSTIDLLGPQKKNLILRITAKQDIDVTDDLIRAVNEATQGLEKVEIKISELKTAIQSEGLPCNIDDLKKRIDKYLEKITQSKTQSKVRFVVE